MEDTKALCSKCYDGEIVENSKVKGEFFCNRCYRICHIKKFLGEKHGRE